MTGLRKTIMVLLLLPAMVWGLLVCLVAAVLPPLRKQAARCAISVDQLANAALDGDEDETISSRAAKAQLDGKRWGCVLCGWLDKIDPGHCARWIEWDRGGWRSK
ncbi:MAG: hypothetical protein KF796_19425 [Ramlibacter sp.]|nr:hypothetical protein [Ramlibacter sp.]